MSTANWIQLVAFIALCAISTPLLGNYMWKVYRGGKAPGDRFFLPVENAIYRLCGIDPEGEQRWNIYALSLLAFSLAGVLLSYLFLRLQGHLPFNPDHMKGVPPALSFNTAISFLTNTNWQAYGGESTMSHLSQMFALVVQQFLSAAVGMAVAVAFIRALIRRRSTTMGSFWVDVVRSTTRVLLPISFIFAFVFMSQGVIQNFHASKTVTTVASQTNPSTGQVSQTQTIPGGPVASQQLDRGAGRQRRRLLQRERRAPVREPEPDHQRALVLAGRDDPVRVPVDVREDGRVDGAGHGRPRLDGDPVPRVGSHLGAVRGEREQQVSRRRLASRRRRPTSAAISKARTRGSASAARRWARRRSPRRRRAPTTRRTRATCRSVERSRSSNILLGEVSPGGAGAGLFGKLILAMLSVFIAGLMVGRTPEYLGKKVQSVEMKLVVLYLIIVPAFVLVFAGVAIAMKTPDHSLLSYGPYCSSYCQQHGLTEMVYTYASATNSNGSAFAGISANTQWFNSTLGIAMLAGRYLLIIPVLAIGGSIGRKQLVPETAGTFRTDTPLFAGLLVVVTVILVGLVYFPVLALGPIVEHLAGHF